MAEIDKWMQGKNFEAYAYNPILEADKYRENLLENLRY